MLALDVRSDESIVACVNAVVDAAGRIDLLVNNAGYELAGALEETSLDEGRAQFETNFFGVIKMVKAVLPLMRQQKQGRIINVASFAGISGIPFMGIYSASKFALEGFWMDDDLVTSGAPFLTNRAQYLKDVVRMRARAISRKIP